MIKNAFLCTNLVNVYIHLKNIKIINADGIVSSENIKDPSYFSMYDIKKIKSLYTNLDTVSFWNIENEINLLVEFL